MSTIRLSHFKFNELYYYGAILYAFLIPFEQKLVTWALVLWLICSLVNYKTRSLVKNGYLWIFPLLFFTYVLSSLYSGVTSFEFLERKLSFLVFPLLFFLHGYGRKEGKSLLKIFVAGLLFSALICLVAAIYRSLEVSEGLVVFTPNLLEGRGFFDSILYGGNHFFGNHFSIFHQTVYYALYLCTGIAILLFTKGLLKLKYRALLIGFFIIILFLVSNKAGFVGLVLVFVIRILSFRVNLLKKVVAAVLILCISLLFALTNPRVKESIGKILKGDITLNKNARYDFTTRLLSWDAAIELIKKEPFWGYGAPNAQRTMNKYYKENEYIYPLKYQLNAHNQVLQIWLENGLLGLIVLMSILILGAKQAKKNKEHRALFAAVLVILFVNILFESIFNRFSGISFFSYLVCFIFSNSNDERETP